MLQEILLSLSGYQSDVFEKVKAPNEDDGGLYAVTSEPERAMLSVLGQIAELHIEIKQSAARIASTHNSPICRGVAAAISDTHLAAFRKKIISVEASILQRDAGFVGAYGIVPLSTIAGEFTPWTRRLQWLQSVTRFALQPDENDPKTTCTGKAMLDFLHLQTRTGYSDLEEMAVSLQVCAQKIWMRTVAAWVLYATLPAFGASDFFVQRQSSQIGAHSEAILEPSLLPSFVGQQTGETILAVGNALNQIQIQLKTTSGASLGPGSRPSDLLPTHLRVLETLRYPLNRWVLQQAIDEIEASISQNALASILPINEVADLLDIIHRYSLLSEGEFATGLIEHGAAKLVSRQSAHVAKPVRKVGRVDDLAVKDAELSGILAKTWDELAVVQSNDMADSKIFRLARDLYVLHGLKSSSSQQTLLSTFMPTPVVLAIDLPPHSNLRLFLQARDLATYSTITCYLLSIRRAELQLAQLWKLTSQRRCHPTPIGPPVSASQYGQRALLTRRTREAQRSTAMRQHWASASKALFVFKEFDAYLHGEVIHNSWQHLQTWLQTGLDGSRPGSSRCSRPGTASSAKTSQAGRSRQMNDPRTLANGHRAFLEALHAGLLLGNAPLLALLKELLNVIDHYVALFSRLSSIWQGLDLQEDEGVVDAFTNHKEEERSVLAEMGRSRASLEDMIASLVEKLKAAEEDRAFDGLGEGVQGLDPSLASHQQQQQQHRFVPWKIRTLDRLIMKLDYLTGSGAKEDDGQNAVDDTDD